MINDRIKQLEYDNMKTKLRQKLR